MEDLYRVTFTIDVADIEQEKYVRGEDRAKFLHKKLMDAAKVLGLEDDIEIEVTKVVIEGEE